MATAGGREIQGREGGEFSCNTERRQRWTGCGRAAQRAHPPGTWWDVTAAPRGRREGAAWRPGAQQAPCFAVKAAAAAEEAAKDAAAQSERAAARN